MAKKKSKAGRKPLSEKERRSRSFTIRFQMNEFRLLLGDAERAGKSPTQFLRDCWQKARGE